MTWWRGSGPGRWMPGRTPFVRIDALTQKVREGDGEPVVFPSQLTAYLEQRDQHREARINLSRDGSYLTLAEARELTMALAKVLHEAASCS